MFENSLQESLLASSILMQKHMSDLLAEEHKDSNLLEAMRYSVLSDGKRIRPFIIFACANIFNVEVTSVLNTAAAMEFVHVYSLVHDDLPAMDNDDYRRGIPTCHKKYDEATAILVGDSLLTYAFETLADQKTHQDALVRCELIKTLSVAAGFKGMAGGQMIDIEKSSQKITNEELARLHRMKTGELFMAAAEMGAILGRANKEQRSALRSFAHDIGLAFQIRDDILDHVGVEVGKIDIDENIHKKAEENASIVDVVGMDQARKQLTLLKDQAIAHLKIFDEKSTRLLKELADFVGVREK